ncbi:MAG TPA: helix-turn-helix domain-containing protein [Balneolaceae bacterium]|nr:helix-turn-helix domain-containing protein [Balneolaceae bacterium]
MNTLKYTVIKTEKQYDEYCNILEDLVFGEEELVSDDDKQDEIELLTLLIEDWDEKQRSSSVTDPVELIKSLMKDHNLNQQDLSEIAGVGKSYISEILNYKKRMSKKVIRNWADYFKIGQDALNRDYKLRANDLSPTF